MGAQTRDIRNAQATRLLDWGFANYATYSSPVIDLNAIKVTGGRLASCPLSFLPLSCVLPKSKIGAVTYQIELPDTVSAPICKGDALGRIVYSLENREIGTVPIVAEMDVPRITFLMIWKRLLSGILLR
jgi:D-alanyl-D-alanine carboxypeptidase (penicillin-binding protein 5/6)